MMSSLRNRILVTLGIMSVPFILGLLLTYEVIKVDWISFMEVQPSFRPIEAPLPLPRDSIPVGGAAFVSGVGSPLNPVEADEVSLQRGKILYDIYCALCHGVQGKGDGPMAEYLTEHEPVDLTGEGVQSESDGALFVLITTGVEEKMPSLKDSLSVRERWDVVNYVKHELVNAVEAAAAPEMVRTPIPTLIPAAMPTPDLAAEAAAQTCSVGAIDLIGAWVAAGYAESDPFEFTDANTGETCVGVFAEDILPLFTEANLWFPGAKSCTACHNADVAESKANLDMSSYEGVLAGSYRDGPGPGDDILEGGDWPDSILYEMLVSGDMPQGRPPDLPVDEHGPLVPAGHLP